MEFYDVLDKRRSIRDYEKIDIPDKIIERIINAGFKAPTNDHMRDWHFIIIKDKTVIKKLIKLIPNEVSRETVNDILNAWNLHDHCQQNSYIDAIPKQYQMLLNASFLIIPLFKQKTDIMKPDNLSHLNGFASIWCCLENIFLAITNEGYASCLRIPLGDEGNWSREVLGYPSDYLMPCFVAVGKPTENAKINEQKQICIKERIHMDKW